MAVRLLIYMRIGKLSAVLAIIKQHIHGIFLKCIFSEISDNDNELSKIILITN